jgi:phosphoribosylformylglycinamidine cyclo-ligase
MSKVHTYREAGVDIDLESEAIASLVKNLTYRRRGDHTMIGGVGHFAGLMRFGEKVLAMTVDGVGTKMLVADRQKDWTTVGIDCIAMNVNDLYVMNIEPISFVDYIATDTLDQEKMAQIGKGLDEGARQANIDIVGGETATLKGLVTGLDLAGTCLGVQDRDKVITGEKIRPGDLIIGVPSSGVHSNGLTLARKIVDEHDAWEEELPGGGSIGKALLTPTRIYHPVLQVAAGAEIHGMCHITGGGLLNFRRLSSYGFRILDPLRPQEIFTWMKEAGGIADEELYRTFNMGMGYAFVAPSESLEQIRAVFPDAKRVGEVTGEPGVYLGDLEIH